MLPAIPEHAACVRFDWTDGFADGAELQTIIEDAVFIPLSDVPPVSEKTLRCQLRKSLLGQSGQFPVRVAFAMTINKVCHNSSSQQPIEPYGAVPVHAPLLVEITSGSTVPTYPGTCCLNGAPESGFPRQGLCSPSHVH